jgi:hypothetical protein
MTTRGFYSAVEHRDAPGYVMVRARCRADLERLLEPTTPEIVTLGIGPIVATLTNADYPYRVTMPRTTWATLLALMAADVTYDNFKHAVARELGEVRERVYMRCWGALLAIEQEDGRVQERNARETFLAAWDAEPGALCRRDERCLRDDGHEGPCDGRPAFATSLGDDICAACGAGVDEPCRHGPGPTGDGLTSCGR